MATAYVYDELYLEHETGMHVENPTRLTAIMRTLEHTGLLPYLVRLEARDASLKELESIHSMRYIQQVQNAAARGGAWLDADTYVSEGTYAAAVRAAGGLLRLVEAVLSGEVDDGFALVRPPGHHAKASRGMGFCLFNNVSIAASYARIQRGLDRVLIVDYDVHHGNGTSDAFYSDPHILFFSTHQYPHYPGTGDWRETGSGKGVGYTINVPLRSGVGDKGYERIFEEVLVPTADRFQPELILVSAGYDAHWHDPLAGMILSVSGYARLVQILMDLANRHCEGRLAFTLEGGYDLDALSHGVAATLAVLSGQEFADPLGPAPGSERDIGALLEQIRELHGIQPRVTS
jgi:acetoin utilization deacetylase AcuC-like enzyme